MQLFSQLQLYNQRHGGLERFTGAGKIQCSFLATLQHTKQLDRFHICNA